MRKLLQRIEAMFTAIAFAEEGEAETARGVMAEAELDWTSAAPQAPSAPRTSAPARPRSRVPRIIERIRKV